MNNLIKNSVKQQKSELIIKLTLIIVMVVAFSSFYLFKMDFEKTAQVNRESVYGSWKSAIYNVDQTTYMNQYANEASLQNIYSVTKDDQILSSISIANDAFYKIGNIHLLSGNLPKENEIVCTTSFLNALGYDYTIGQTITINVLPIDGTLESSLIQSKQFVLSGVLPAYDTLWQKDGHLLSSAIITNDTFDASNYTVFSPDEIQNDNSVYNAFAYTSNQTLDVSTLLVLGLIALVGLLVNVIGHAIYIQKHLHSYTILLNLGAKKSQIKKMIISEKAMIDIVGFIIGCIIAFVVGYIVYATNLFTNVLLLYVLALVALDFIIGCIYSLLLKFNNRNIRSKAIPLEKKFKVIRFDGFGFVTCTLVLFVMLSSLFIDTWQSGSYALSKDYSVMNARANTTLFDESLIENLKQFPEVKEVSASRYLDTQYIVTSKEIRESEFYNYVALYGSSMMSPPPINFYRPGLLSNSIVVLSDADMKAAMKDTDISNDTKQAIIDGEGILYYHQQFYQDEKSGEVYNFYSDTDAYSKVKTPIEAGQYLTISDNITVDSYDHDYTHSNMFNEDIPVLGVINTFSSDTTFVTDNSIINGTIFVSNAFYEKYYHVLSDSPEIQYNHINIKLQEDASYALRNSIVSLITSHKGTVNSDMYEIVSHEYTQSQQNHFMIQLSCGFFLLISMIIFLNHQTSMFQLLKYRIGTFKALGASNQYLIRKYIQSECIQLALILLITNALVSCTFLYFNTTTYTLSLLKIHTYNQQLTLTYPYMTQLIMNLIFIIDYISINLLPFMYFIQHESIKDLKDAM